jgi:hypothetical protein
MTSSRQLYEALCFYLQRGTSEHCSTSRRFFLPICLLYYYSLQIIMGFKNKKTKNKNALCQRDAKKINIPVSPGGSVQQYPFWLVFGRYFVVISAITSVIWQDYVNFLIPLPPGRCYKCLPTMPWSLPSKSSPTRNLCITKKLDTVFSNYAIAL